MFILVQGTKEFPPMVDQYIEEFLLAEKSKLQGAWEFEILQKSVIANLRREQTNFKEISETQTQEVISGLENFRVFDELIA